jgi:hypothetical protein
MVDAGLAYPVIWSEANEKPSTGRLTPGRQAMTFQGTRDGNEVERSIPYDDVAGISIGRTPGSQLNGRATIVIARRDEPDLLVQPYGPGLLHELADVLSELCAREEPLQRIAIVLPLRADSLETVRALVAGGPPFDPSDKSLSRHEVFLTGREAVFVFSGSDACESVRQIMSDPTVLRSANRWSEFIDGTPRLAEAEFSWPPMA